MGDRNYLHVCRHCGIVQATASETGPRACIVCGGITFSKHYSNASIREARVVTIEGQKTNERAGERVTVERVR